MWELIALGLYSVQWLGVVLGVGAEVVLLCAHLIALHEHKPQWLKSIPSVRVAQLTGLILIVVSGLGAVIYHIAAGQGALPLLPVFLFKWVLIGVVVVCYLLEQRLEAFKALREGLAGGTWLGLFLVHSIAPVSTWAELGVFYAGWMAAFGVVWGSFVALMRYTSKPKAPASTPVKVSHPQVPPPKAPTPAPAPVPKPVLKVVVPPKPPPPPPKPASPPPPPKPVPPPPLPSVALAKEGPAPKPTPVIQTPAPAASLPAVQPLEMEPPHEAPKKPVESYTPDYAHLPGLRVMPQRAEDMHLHNRAPVTHA